MTNHPTGDTALSRAITTGAPVATNDAQAAELTQKWGVWFRGHPANGYSDAGWCHNHYGDLTFEDASVARTRMVASGYSDASHEVRPYPTPRPAPPASSGGEWKAFDDGDMFEVTNKSGNPAYRLDSRPAAIRLAARLNAADAMEKALKQIADKCGDPAIEHIALAALRGGA